MNESIIGSPGDNTSLGSVYVFEINSSSHQLQKQKIVPILTAGESNRTKFGASITTFEAELLIGAPDANDFTGKVYHYNRGDGNYTFLHSLIDSNGSQDEQFGYALALALATNCL